MTLTTAVIAIPGAIAALLLVIAVLMIHARAHAVEMREREFGDFPLPSSLEGPRRNGVFRFRHPIRRETCGPVVAGLLAATGAVFLFARVLT